ncbi:MAG TPA: putative baseplate assembly protein [Polyangiales bacterium]|nr:putative baseplate assembly protein [Polyangiales bacterium]
MTGCGCATQPCDCCTGTQVLTPRALHNRPGLPALAYRAGTHASFMQTMQARLSAIEVERTGSDGQPLASLRPLAALSTRDPSDPSIAMLDAWATAGDVLTFYQERIANECYLGTASERRSVLELARLVGYGPRPGVAATAYLAYTLDDNQADPVTIPIGTRAQSVPGPGENAQTFETSEPLLARREWNDLKARRKRPQAITFANAKTISELHVAGVSTQLKPGDPLLLLFGADRRSSVIRKVASIDIQFPDQRTVVALQPMTLEKGPIKPSGVTSPDAFVQRLLVPQVPQVRNSLQLTRSLAAAFGVSATPPAPPAVDSEDGEDGSDSEAPPKYSDTTTQLLLGLAPQLKQSYYAAWQGARVNPAQAPLLGVYALRARVTLFGATAPKLPTYGGDHAPDGILAPPDDWRDWDYTDDEAIDNAFIDQANDAIAPGSYVLTDIAGAQRVLRVASVQVGPRSAYNLSGPSTQLKFDLPDGEGWRELEGEGESSGFDKLRKTQLYVQSERLSLLDVPLGELVEDQEIELDGLYKELVSGRWAILSGERADIAGVAGVRSAELLMITGLRHGYDPELPGDQVHTTLILATPPAYRYKRDSLVIYGNVVKATHGETRQELLGNGDGAQRLQSFVLKQPPLTFVAAPSAAGAASTLHVRVNEVEWSEAESLARLGPKDRGYATLTDDAGNTTVVFGDGQHGARLPSGVQNVAAEYRNGIGKGGNVKAEQISSLITRPLGVKAVLNPLRASGGADKESRDSARENAPLSVMALDRLVSVRDYADFARRFAGIAKAQARRVSDGQRQLLHLTVAGADDIPIDRSSDLYANLVAALHDLGDADLPLRVDPRERIALVLGAKVKLRPGHAWEPVAAALRARLCDVFGFDKRALGQPALLCEVIGSAQNLAGVEYVDVDAFGGVAEMVADTISTPNGTQIPVRRLSTQDEVAAAIAAIVAPNALNAAGQPSDDVIAWPGGMDDGVLRPAEIAVFMPEVPDTLILNQIR